MGAVAGSGWDDRRASAAAPAVGRVAGGRRRLAPASAILEVSP